MASMSSTKSSSSGTGRAWSRRPNDPAVAKRRARAVELVHKGLSFDEVARCLGYSHRSSARTAYIIGLGEALARAERERAGATAAA